MSTQDIGLNNSASNLNYQTESRAVEHLSTRSDAITYQPVQLSDLPDVHQLEADGFAADEAASMTTIQYRHSVAPDLFIGAYADRRLIGFINATCSPSETLDHDSMTCHDPQGKNVLIHSVCVAGHRRRAKVATRMLREYLERCSQAGYSSVVLVCHDELKPLYMGVGFEDRGPSSLVHGARPWSELMLHLPLKNPTRLLCPVERCRCVILRKGVGRFMTMPESPLPALQHIPSTGESSSRCWLVSSPTEFENIGFSKPVGQVGGKERRWLSCGACDYGPLGWTESSTNLAAQFSANPQARFANVLFLLEDNRVFSAPTQ
ncbi:hypothetical protein PCASD_09644 [Puccinia coronata f. sp. avenae]|uniref:N-acetyltransferase domain-containing protein n=1 Tax=Puccinia coronata f. sp. avenae TaxID=200324 RepID=A0A2N5UHW9_9BASI|nr:hypothetical protein PCASD_09644 [Puccinia coronata f. sp. avenae]